MRIGSVYSHKNGIERIAMNRFDECIRPVMPGDAEVANDLLIARFEQRLHCSALGEYFIDISHGADVVQLPKVNVIGLQQLQRSIDHLHGTIACPLFRFCCEKASLRRCFMTLPTYCSLQRSGPP